MPDHDTYYDFSNICIRSEPEKSELCMLFAAYRRFMLSKANTVIDQKKAEKGARNSGRTKRGRCFICY